MNKNLYYILLLIIPGFVSGQSPFINSGNIKYERKVNAFRLTEGTWLNNAYEKNKFQTDTFQLNFDSVQSYYFNPSYDPDLLSFQEMNWSISVAPSKSSFVYKRLMSDTFWAVRDLFDERIVINDSMRQPVWKISDETREIAGFKCRKAVCVLYDSVYVVAFFSDQILPKSGPETFGNLPGMILGLAVPRLYTTWMAIEIKPLNSPVIKPEIPKKKKNQYHWNSYYNKLSERFKDWGPPFNTLLVWMWGI